MNQSELLTQLTALDAKVEAAQEQLKQYSENPESDRISRDLGQQHVTLQAFIEYYNAVLDDDESAGEREMSDDSVSTLRIYTHALKLTVDNARQHDIELQPSN